MDIYRTTRTPVVVMAALTVLATTLTALVAGAAGQAQAQTQTETQIQTQIQSQPYILYDDEIRNGFDNWSWADVDLDHRQIVADGTSSVAVDAGGWEAFFLGRITDGPLPLWGTLEFKVHGGTSDSPIGVRLHSREGASGSLTVEVQAGAWTDVAIDLADFGSFAQFSGVWFDNQSGDDRPTFYIDDIRVVPQAAPGPVAGPALDVDLGDRTITRRITDPASGAVTDQQISFPHPISDEIYGMNFATDAVREELAIPVNRWGGNHTERFNHEIATSNLGQDWFFMNSPEEVGDDHAFENDNQADNTDTLLTLPMLGWVAKNRDANCSYPTVDVLGPAANAGPQDSEEPHWLNQNLLCGNGMRNGQELPGADQTITSRAADSGFAADWVEHLVDTHGSAADGGVEYYALGNEPGLWYSTHRDVRHQPIGRTELIERSIDWAGAVKAADPTASVVGPVLFGGYSYYVTSEEILRGDRPGPDVPTFVADYLTAMNDAGDAAGTRLLDALAVNFYDDRTYGEGTDALRLEATRDLWDPDYAPADWWVIRDFLYGEGHAVVPRLKSLIDANHPGTDLAITEYNFGGNNSMAGGLAQADALGIFGREGLDLATVWDPYADWVNLTEQEWADRPIIDAFRLYRNYDGRGSRFGDVSVHGASADEAKVAIHAATRSADGALTLVVINKTRNAYRSPLTVNGTGAGFDGPAKRYLYSADTGGDIVAGGQVTVSGGSVNLELPARSATVVVLTPGDVGGGEVELPTPGAGTELIDPPSTTAEGGPLDSADTAYVWLEQGPIELDRRLRVTRLSDGTFDGKANQRRTIRAGTTICSFFVGADRLDDRGGLAGSIDFERSKILGVISRGSYLSRSSFLEAPGTEYVYGGTERSDQLTLDRGPGGGLDFNLLLGRGVDHIRVITDCG
jgi:hypothetical protein